MPGQVQQDLLETQLLTEAIWQKYGYDFRQYASASFKRRLHKVTDKYGLSGTAELLHQVLVDPAFFSRLLNDLTVTVTELFRDAAVYRALREQVIPHLRAYPEIKVWCAGCAGGEEAFSIAVLLHEEGLLNRSIIYGTDINLAALKRASQGIVSLEAIQTGTKNYLAAGGKTAFYEYYTAKYGAALIHPFLRKNIVLSDHNLVSDREFGEMNLVLCRNVLIYFDRKLQDRALGLFRKSLHHRGFLCIGTKENLRVSEEYEHFEDFCAPERIYRRKVFHG